MFVVQNDETGREFVYASEEKYDAAMDWYDVTSKGEIEAWCAARGIVISEKTDDAEYRNGIKLVDDWADVAMHAYAEAN